MMIALPNQDKTWTVTLFMPFEIFSEIESSEDLLDFFGTYFPDAIPLIGKERLIKDFFKTKPQYLVAVKCNPYHISSKVLLIGDAGHSVVPFYGQGMNAGFEDCTILTELFNKHRSDLESILSEFSKTRWEDAHAISDLAMYNYIEMRDLVNKRCEGKYFYPDDVLKYFILAYLIRKSLDDFLFWLLPSFWVPLYNSVSFTHMSYKKCIENRAWQDRTLNKTLKFGGFVALCSLTIGAYQIARSLNISGTIKELSN